MIAVERNNMESAGSRFQIQSEPYSKMILRLSKKRAARVVIIDSIQYLRISLKQYQELRQKFPDTLFIFLSHAKKNTPKGAVADEIMYDADVKVFVKDFVADVRSRFGGNAPYIIWEEGANKRLNN